jgi:hypothetical protein
MVSTYTGRTQNNGAVSIVFTIETAPFFCVYLYMFMKLRYQLYTWIMQIM